MSRDTAVKYHMVCILVEGATTSTLCTLHCIIVKMTFQRIPRACMKATLKTAGIMTNNAHALWTSQRVTSGIKSVRKAKQLFICAVITSSLRVISHGVIIKR